MRLRWIALDEQIRDLDAELADAARLTSGRGVY
jgi:hypothetical protein